MEKLFQSIKSFTFIIKQTKVGRRCIYFLKDIGLWDCAMSVISHRIANHQRKSPTSDMLASREFYKLNESRIQNVVSFLYDEKSRVTFLNMIDFRCSGKWNVHFGGDMRGQYFRSEIFKFSQDEIFVDCGAYNGDTIRSFKKYFRKKENGGYKKIIAFEPSKKLSMLLSKDHPDVTIVNCGVWSEDTTLTFVSEEMPHHNAAADLSDCNRSDLLQQMHTNRKKRDLALTTLGIFRHKAHENTSQNSTLWPVTSDSVILPVVAIDNCQECKDGVTFIKMDIEGAELNALKGAENTILHCKPKLAICIYHSNEDMLAIAEWIHEKVPEYKLFVRHHIKYSPFETVLYATI